MHIADRIILTLYTLMMVAVSLTAMLFYLGFFPFDLLVHYITALHGRWETIVSAAVLFLVSVRLLIAGIGGGGGSRDLTVHIGDEGVVKISIVAVRKFIEGSAAQVRGVHNIKAKISVKGDNLQVKLTAGVLPEANIPEISKLMQDKIKDSVKETIGREVSGIQILFNTISYEAKPK
jgi:uncharacterized alkaline shock family protein YloU